MIAFESLLPVFLVIVTGWALRHFNVIQGVSWNGLEKIAYHVLMPALVTTTLVTTSFDSIDFARIALLSMVPAVLITILLLVFRPQIERLLEIDSPGFTSLMQGSIRWNAFVGFALSLQLYGKQGLSILSVAICVLVPYANAVSAYVLSRHGRDGKRVDVQTLIKTLAANPFIWSTALGLIIKISGVQLPQIILQYGDVLGRGALAAGLLLVGSGLVFKSLNGAKKPLGAALLLKLILSPIIAGELGMIMGLSGASLAVPVIIAAAPTAAASFIMAKQNGGDAELMAGIATVQTLTALITIPLILLRYAG